MELHTNVIYLKTLESIQGNGELGKFFTMHQIYITAA